MIVRNPLFASLTPNYLFSEITKRKDAFLAEHPDAQLINLSIGDTSQPLIEPVTEALITQSRLMGTPEGYQGYGPERGIPMLRQAIVDQVYGGQFSREEIFVTDGIACDIGRLQILLGEGRRVAVQDPCYPAYIDTSLLMGAKEIRYLPLRPEKRFFIDLDALDGIDLLFFCSPHNPTGITASFEEMEALVEVALKKKILLLFDAAYAAYAKKEEGPRSIFEIPGAHQVAIELGSLSKWAGFTGLRLSWSVVPKELTYADGTRLLDDWGRTIDTCFNGASILSQHAALGALSEQGQRELAKQIALYLENGRLLKEALVQQGVEVYGGQGPYLWCSFAKKSSWEAFEWLLEKLQIITIPGVGFGPSGENFIRMSLLGLQSELLKAVERIKRC